MSESADLMDGIALDPVILRLNRLARHRARLCLGGLDKYSLEDGPYTFVDNAEGYSIYLPANPKQDSRIIAGKESPSLEEALSQFRPFGNHLRPLPSFFKGFRLHGEVNCSRYSLGAVSGTGRYPYEKLAGRGRWFDSPYTFVLTYDGEPIATASFRAEPGAVCITQIQGIRGHADELSRIKWPNALIEAATHWCAENEVPGLRVLPHYKVCGDKSKMKNSRLKYDEPATERGFEWDQNKEVYRKEVEPTPIQGFYFRQDFSKFSKILTELERERKSPLSLLVAPESVSLPNPPAEAQEARNNNP